jgi:1-acyl-sn-glycerol-3-phosphate acyltransferase
MNEVTTIWSRIASFFIWIVAGGFLVFALSFLTILYRFVKPDRIQFLERLYCRLQLALTFNRQTHHVNPAVDPTTQYIFIQNHTSHLDHVAMYTSTPHFKQGIELESHFDYPFYGWFMRARGTIPVPRDRTGALNALRESIRAEVGAGHSILGFPEGHRTLDGHVGRFHDGLFRIAIELGVPVVPVAVTGLYEVLHKGSLIIRPGNEVVVHVEEPIPTGDMAAEDFSTLRDRVRDLISARVDAHLTARARERSDRTHIRA